MNPNQQPAAHNLGTNIAFLQEATPFPQADFVFPAAGWAKNVVQEGPMGTVFRYERPASGDGDGYFMITRYLRDDPNAPGYEGDQLGSKISADTLITGFAEGSQAQTHILPNQWFKSADGSLVEGYAEEAVITHPSGQQYRLRTVVRTSVIMMFSLVYFEKAELWDESIWANVFSAVRVNTVSAPASAAPSVIPAAVPVPMPTPANVGSMPAPASTKSKKGWIIGGAIAGVVVLVAFTGLLVALLGGNDSTLDKAHNDAAKNAQTLLENEKNTAVGGTLDVDGVQIHAEKFIRNYAGESYPVHPGDAEEFVHVVFSITNKSNVQKTISDIDISPMLNNELTYPWSNHEPDAFDADVVLAPNQSVTRSMMVHITSSQSSTAKFKLLYSPIDSTEISINTLSLN